MLVHESTMQCSTSYAPSKPPSRCTDRCWTIRRYKKCSNRARRLTSQRVSADKEATDVVNWRKQPEDLVATPSRPFGGQRRFVDFRSTQTKDGAWAKEFEENDDWTSFWDDESYVFDDPALDDTYDGLFTGLCTVGLHQYQAGSLLHVWHVVSTGSSANTELITAARKRIATDLTSPEWRKSHPNYISPPPVPQIKKYHPDIPDPEPIAPHDWTEFELRAWLEKRRRKEKTDAAWQQRQQLIGR